MSTEQQAKATLLRSVAELEIRAKTRTLEGVATPYDVWATVRDLVGPAYEEAHARSSFVESLRRNPEPRPVYSNHSWMLGNPAEDPVGVVHFTQTPTALRFRAFLSRTAAADAQLELVADGAKRAVSIAFDPLRTTNVPRPRGIGKLRVESRLRELSIVPTGMGQYAQAVVTSMRSRGTTRPPMPALAERQAATLAARRQACAQDWRMVRSGGLLRSTFDEQWEDFCAEHGGP